MSVQTRKPAVPPGSGDPDIFRLKDASPFHSVASPPLPASHASAPASGDGRGGGGGGTRGSTRPWRGRRGAAGGSPGGAAQRGGPAAAEPGGDARARGGAVQGNLPHPRGLRRHRTHKPHGLPQVVTHPLCPPSHSAPD